MMAVCPIKEARRLREQQRRRGHGRQCLELEWAAIEDYADQTPVSQYMNCAGIAYNLKDYAGRVGRIVRLRNKYHAED